VAGACGEVVRKRVAYSWTDSRSDTASACGRGSVVRICRLMWTQYFEIRTPLTVRVSRMSDGVSVRVSVIVRVSVK